MEWRQDHSNVAVTQEQIDSRFIDIVTDIAWRFGCKVFINESPAKDEEDPYVTIDVGDGTVNFTNIAKGDTQKMAIEVQERIDKFYDDWDMQKVQ